MTRRYAGRRKRNFRRKRAYVNKTKKMVVGHGPTMLERIASGAGSVATLAKAVMPAIMAINTEQKFLDTAVTLTAISIASPYIACLNLMAQGTGEQNRIGNSLMAKNITIRGTIQQTWASGDEGFTNRIRMIIFADKSQAGTLPTIGDLLMSTTNNESPTNRNNSDRFVIIKDKFFTFNRSADVNATNGLTISYPFKIFKKLDYHIRYIGTGGTNASCGQNALYIFAQSNSNDASFATGIDYYARLNFTDN